jgi:hypothetical protein
MNAKCSFERESENLKEGAPSLGLGFWIDEWRAWGQGE